MYPEGWDEDQNRGPCDICGEEIDYESPLPSKNEAGEFCDPADPGGKHYIAHAQCGIDAGFQLA